MAQVWPTTCEWRSAQGPPGKGSFSPEGETKGMASPFHGALVGVSGVLKPLPRSCSHGASGAQRRLRRR